MALSAASKQFRTEQGQNTQEERQKRVHRELSQQRALHCLVPALLTRAASYIHCLVPALLMNVCVLMPHEWQTKEAVRKLLRVFFECKEEK